MATQLEFYKAISGSLRIKEVYGLSEEAYKSFRKAGLPVYRSMSGSLNMRDDRAYNKKQIAIIIKLSKI